MKKIEIFEKAMNEGGRLKDYGINSTLFAAYRDCQETGNDNIDFNGVISVSYTHLTLPTSQQV